MQYQDQILYKTHQHVIVLISKILAMSIPYAVLLIFAILFFPDFMMLFVALLIFGLAGIIFWNYFFWVKSYFIVSNQKIIVKVRNGLFSKFHMSIHYKNIRDTAFSKNHILHYMFGHGTLFARSSAGAVGDLEAHNIPNVEKLYKIVNALHNLEESERKMITKVEDLSGLGNITDPERIEAVNIVTENIEKAEKETKEEATQKEKAVLLQIQGIKEVVELSDKDRRYIFEHEEDRNHGVYEALRKQVLLAATHDSTFRDPDEAIVMKAGEKVIFPTVKFHEIKRPSVISSSPGLEVHNYLTPKFQNMGDYDATLLIGFDI